MPYMARQTNASILMDVEAAPFADELPSTAMAWTATRAWLKATL